MTTTVMIEIPMQPIPKGRPRRGAGGHWYTPERTRAYEEAVAWYCAGQRSGLWAADVDVDVRIVLHLRRLAGDLDNYAKSILDGMEKSALIENDRQVKELTVQLVLDPDADEKAVVHIAPSSVAA